MKFKSALMTEVSGSIGGVTFAHNKGGMYVRARSIPVNPNTPYQQAVRSYMGQANEYYRLELTDEQRSGWDALAYSLWIQDVFGDNRKLTGMQWFCALNVLRLQASLAIQEDRPLYSDRKALADWSIDEIDATAQEIDIAWSNYHFDEDDPEQHALVFVSRPTGTSVNYFKGPYRLAGVISGDDVSPPTSPASIALPFAVLAGQRVHVKIVQLSGVNMHSPPFRSCGTAIEPA